MYIKGKISKIIFSSQDGYYVGVFKIIEKDFTYLKKTITFTGYFHEINENFTYILNGELVNHPKYNEQFNITSYEIIKPDKKDAMIEFLSSGMFKGIGEVKAKKIVDKLGKNTFKTILENPSNLILIPTITNDNIKILHNTLKEYESSYDDILYLTKLSFTPKDANIIYNRYKKDTKNIIKDNIYKLYYEIYDFSFKKIDNVALNIINNNDIRRVEACIYYIMNEISNNYGHCYYYLEEITYFIPKILHINIDDNIINDAINNLINNSLIIKKNNRYYIYTMYEAENFISKRLNLLNKDNIKCEFNLAELIKKIENKLNIKYNEEQIDAIKTANLNNILIITGGPGTGKTTILKGIIELYKDINKGKDINKSVALLSPTGRAAKKMSDVTNLEAYTIHRFLKWQKDDNSFLVNEYNKSKVDTIILDEASMIDTYLFYNLLKGISYKCRIIIIGDDHQLPSVGAGNLLYDFINSRILPVIKLNKLYRQKENSNIISLAYDIRNSIYNDTIFNKDEDLTFIECKNTDIKKNIIEIYNTYKDLSIKELQILIPVYKGINGIDNINNLIQEKFNKTKSNTLIYSDYKYIENDKVIQLTNQPDDNIYNGDIGEIKNIITKPKKEIYIEYDNNIVRYTPSNFINFKLAYSISIHKAQGSEFDVVIIPLSNEYKNMLYQKLIYTAVTRAKTKLYLIGEKEAFIKAINNKDNDKRKTTIIELLNEK